MKSMITTLIATVLAVASLHSPAQTLRVATGGAKGTYSTLFKEMVNACGTEVPLVEVNSTGSMENVNNLVGNQVNAAFVQSDVLYLRARTEELGNVKTLLALHSEQVHIVARAASGLKTGGVMGVGGSAVTFTDLSSLAGYKVGAAGGSVVTAEVIHPHVGAHADGFQRRPVRMAGAFRWEEIDAIIVALTAARAV